MSTIGTPLLAAFNLTRENRVFKPKKYLQVTRAGWARGRRPGQPVPQALNKASETGDCGQDKLTFMKEQMNSGEVGKFGILDRSSQFRF